MKYYLMAIALQKESTNTNKNVQSLHSTNKKMSIEINTYHKTYLQNSTNISKLVTNTITIV